MTPAPAYSPPRTRPLRPAGGTPPDPDTTDYELSASTIVPPVRLVPPEELSRPQPARPLPAAERELFHQRLRLCCLVAAAPFAFFFFCSATGFIELFARPVVGVTGLTLSAGVLLGLTGTALALFRLRTLEENVLRALEIGVFGLMGLCVAYWQFTLLTADIFRRPPGDTPDRAEQYSVLAAALIVHISWSALIVFHGMLIPNSPARGVGVALTMALIALLIDGTAAAIHDPTTRHAGVVFAIAAANLSAAVGLSVFGTAKTAALRQEVETARQAVRELGQYRLRRKLGQGGMGEVYLAEHRLLKRPCAVKRIHRKFLDNPDQVKRFAREVQTTALLRHPNTVEVYDYGQAEDGTFYYVMEYLPGPSLEDLVGKHGPLPADRVVHILRQVCGALREAHHLGLVHRDIKPSNILVFPDGSPHDQAKVVDFGLVQSLTADIDPNSKITRDGLIVGTPEYMSPEQAQGLTLDERSDLFSLGVVAYFLLTGKEAFHRDNPVRTLLAVVNEEPKPLTEVNPHVPADVAAVVAKCMTKTLDGRYLRAGDLEEALGKCECVGGWTAPRCAEWWVTHPGTDPSNGTDLAGLAYDEIR